MTTAELVNLVVSRLDSIEHHQTAFRKEVREDVEEIKQLARLTNGRVTALERREIDEKARLEERQRIDQEQAAGREKKIAPGRQVMISVAAGVTVAVAVGVLSHFGLV